MTLDNPERVVFDCPVYAQALINARGPAAACLDYARTGRLALFVSDYVVQEIRELPRKLKPRLGVTAALVARFLEELARFALPVSNVPPVYLHPIDPDDSHYINLAIATSSKLIVTRDRHLLNLTDESRAEARDFQSRFTSISIITPDALLQGLRAS